MILHERSCFIEFIEQVGGKVIKCETVRAFYQLPFILTAGLQVV